MARSDAEAIRDLHARMKAITGDTPMVILNERTFVPTGLVDPAIGRALRTKPESTIINYPNTVDYLDYMR